MKHTLAIFGLIFMINVHATVEDTSKTYVHPTDAEITRNRACFQDLEVQGCRSQEEDQEQFRSCLSNALPGLEDYCKKLMLNLYGTSK